MEALRHLFCWAQERADVLSPTHSMAMVCVRGTAAVTTAAGAEHGEQAPQELPVVLMLTTLGGGGERQSKGSVEVDRLGEGVDELEAQMGGTGVGVGLDTRGVGDVGEAEEARDGHGQGRGADDEEDRSDAPHLGGLAGGGGDRAGARRSAGEEGCKGVHIRSHPLEGHVVPLR